MTADQFQRDVVDILGLLDKEDSDRLDMAVSFFQTAANATTGTVMARDIAIAIAILASTKGYSLETIFQMALDELEKEKQNESHS
jgi:hypothetical protein